MNKNLSQELKQQVSEMSVTTISRKKILKEKISQNQVEIELVKKELFYKSILHEISNPLTSIMGFTEYLLDEENITQEQKQMLATIEKEAARISDMLTLLGQLAHSQSDFDSMDLFDLMNQLEDDFRKRMDKDIKLSFVFDKSLKNLYVADNTIFFHIALNLISNAIKYTEKGFVEVVAEISGKKLVLRVTDSGRGIPSDDLPHIFDKFFRGKDAKEKVGTGVGLSISQQMAHLLDGTITVESKVGEGSVFTLSAPYIR